MLKPLVVAELKLALRSPRTRRTALVALVLAGLATGLGAARFEARRETHRGVSRLGDERFASQPADHPHSIAHRGYLVCRPPPPLGFLDDGLDAALGRWIRLDAHTARPLEGARLSAPVRAPGGGRFDLGLFFGLVAPALVLALGFDRIAGDDPRARLGMLRAAGVRAGPYLLAKMLGLSTRVGLSVFAPAAALALTTTLALAPGEWRRTLAWLAVQLLGLAAWTALVLAVSAFARAPRAALGAGLAAWALLTVVVPPVASTAARALTDAPPPAALAARLAAWAESAHAQDEALRARAVDDIRRRHPTWDGQAPAPEVVEAVMLNLADASLADRMRDLLDEVAAEQRKEANLAAALGFASPSGLTLLAGSAVAGSDLAAARAAADHFEAFRRRLVGWLNTWWADNGTGGFEAGDTLSDLDAAPRPSAPYPDLDLARRGCRLPCMLLVGALLVFGATAALGVRRRLEGSIR